ncbi:Lar-like restriction alleviation protein [Salmonella phage IME207]|uniref:Restriction alleviation protein n=1 Tax=Salmonella phage IME207 TaxID=1873985 RepID=A0A1B1W2D7_9CAUD|nr:Lar-like restriction alleviation protein [Salmonella phage IME207]ANW46827.1 hypothetical protein [Salmonella phage IME207]
MSAPHMPMMNDEGLLECPFCGSGETTMDREGGLSQIVCLRCAIATDLYQQESFIIKKWNTRNGHLYTADDFNHAAKERDYGL